MKMSELKEKHKDIVFSNWQKIEGIHVRSVRQNTSHHIMRGSERIGYVSDDIDELDRILSNIEFLSKWIETTIEAIEQIKEVEITRVHGFDYLEREIHIAIKPIGFATIVKPDRTFDGNLCVKIDRYSYIFKKTTLGSLKTTITDCVEIHANDAKKIYEDALKISSSMRR